MNIVEAIEIINEILSDEFLLTAFNQDSSFESRQIKANAIETLLTAYEKEKEKNKEHKQRITYLENKIFNQKQIIKEGGIKQC